jgi:hypothetical protein
VDNTLEAMTKEERLARRQQDEMRMTARVASRCRQFQMSEMPSFSRGMRIDISRLLNAFT